MSRRDFTASVILALPIALLGSLTGAGLLTLPPSSGLTFASAQRACELTCDSGNFKGWLELRFDHLPPRPIVVDFSNGRQLMAVARPDGWLFVTESGPTTEQPKEFLWQSGHRVRVHVPPRASLVEWTLHRENLPPDSSVTHRKRTVLGFATFLLMLLSSTAAVVAPRVLTSEENVTPERVIESMIKSCRLPDRKQTSYLRDVLRAAALEGTSLEIAATAHVPYPSSKKRKAFATRAVVMLRQKISRLQSELAAVMQRLGAKHQ